MPDRSTREFRGIRGRGGEPISSARRSTARARGAEAEAPPPIPECRPPLAAGSGRTTGPTAKRRQAFATAASGHPHRVTPSLVRNYPDNRKCHARQPTGNSAHNRRRAVRWQRRVARRFRSSRAGYSRHLPRHDHCRNSRRKRSPPAIVRPMPPSASTSIDREDSESWQENSVVIVRTGEKPSSVLDVRDVLQCGHFHALSGK